MVNEYNSSGSTLASYVLGGTGLISQTRGTTTSYFLQDGQGSTRALTSSSSPATVTDTYSYTAFGESFSHTGTTTNPYQYTGQQFDSLTGLYDLRARYYNPALGRFLSQDTYPINFNNPVEWNRYGYTGNNPINGMDPTGNDFIEYLGILAGRAGVATTTAYFVVRAYSTLIYYAAQLAPYTFDEINDLIQVGQFTLMLGGEALSWVQTLSQLQVQPGTQTITSPLINAEPTDTQSEETPESGRIVVELGSGDFSNLPLIKAENSGARIIGIEHPQTLDILNAARIGPGASSAFDSLLLNYNIAIASGIEVEFIDYTFDLPKLGLMGQVDKVISIAPSPGTMQNAHPLQTADAAAYLIKHGGEIYIATELLSVANQMAASFSAQFGINVKAKEVPRITVPYQSEYLDGFSNIYLINFTVP